MNFTKTLLSGVKHWVENKLSQTQSDLKEYINSKEFVGYTEQNLTDEQKSQVRANIGAESVGAANSALSSAKSYVDAEVAGMADVLNSSISDKANTEDVDAALEEAKAYADTKVADLVNSAPETLDTLGELAAAMESNSGVVETLNSAITTKANASDLTSHTGNKSNPHKVTAAQVGAVSYSAQTLTDAQKAQARSNIGILQADWNQTDETAMDFILNKPEAITDEEIDAICGGVETIDITENVLTDTATGLVYRIYVTDGKLSMKEISGVTGTEDLVFVDTYTDAVYKVYVENGKLNMTEVE